MVRNHSYTSATIWNINNSSAIEHRRQRLLPWTKVPARIDADLLALSSIDFFLVTLPRDGGGRLSRNVTAAVFHLRSKRLSFRN